ncbi:hypothetical protein [Paraburkholderia diazotrophica]|uniref:hypothetical protein n=1 Tax=Paraburkholderia diazotrophica TaxID=667676 RepID=UPI0031788086
MKDLNRQYETGIPHLPGSSSLHRLRTNSFSLAGNALIARYCFNAFAPYYGSSKSRFIRGAKSTSFDRPPCASGFFLRFAFCALHGLIAPPP